MGGCVLRGREMGHVWGVRVVNMGWFGEDVIRR